MKPSYEKRVKLCLVIDPPFSIGYILKNNSKKNDKKII